MKNRLGIFLEALVVLVGILIVALSLNAKADSTVVLSSSNVRFTGFTLSSVTAIVPSDNAPPTTQTSWVLSICAETTNSSNAKVVDCKQTSMSGDALTAMQNIVNTYLLPWWKVAEGL